MHSHLEKEDSGKQSIAGLAGTVTTGKHPELHC